MFALFLDDEYHSKAWRPTEGKDRSRSNGKRSVTEYIQTPTVTAVG